MAVVNIIHYDKDKNAKIDSKTLEDVLRHSGVRDKPAAIYSIAGPQGTEKPVLLNLFLLNLSLSFVKKK